MVAEAFLPTLKTLFDAPDTSPLSEVKAGNVAELLVQLTNARHQLNKERADEASQVTNSRVLNCQVTTAVI